MQRAFLFFSFFFLIIFSSLAQKGNLIPWKEDRPLTWKDFKGRAELSTPFHALTCGMMNYTFESLSSGEIKMTINVCFEPKKSWVKTKKATYDLLEHEQCHFDVFEIYARLFVRRLEEGKALQGKNFSDKTQKIFDKTFNELQKFQEKYDKETDHSNNIEVQKKWSLKIKNLLEENKEFAKREFIISPNF